MGFVRSHTFFCCLPVRLGVFVMSTLSLLGSGFVAVVCWVGIHQVNAHQITLDHTQQIVLDVLTGLFTFMALVSLGGLIGCATRNLPLTRIYNGLNWVLFMLSLVAGGLGIYQIFRTNDINNTAYNNCLKSNGNKTDAITTAKCHTESAAVSTVTRVLIVVMFVVFWLILSYCCHIVSSYVSQLEEEQMADERHAPAPTTIINMAQPTYAAAPYNPNQEYAFTAQGNAYGKV